jgi:NADPH:quinone reductase
MKAILCTRYGGPDDLELAELPDPKPGPGEAVVRVKATALNFFDTLIIAGKYQVKPAFPFSPGAEFSGVVEAVGDGVTLVAPGDRVAAATRYGAARERIVINADRLVKLPDTLDFTRAAGLIVTYARRCMHSRTAPTCCRGKRSRCLALPAVSASPQSKSAN